MRQGLLPWKSPAGKQHATNRTWVLLSALTRQPLLLPRFILLIVSAGLDVSCQFYLHVPEQRDHLELLHLKNKKTGSSHTRSHKHKITSMSNAINYHGLKAISANPLSEKGCKKFLHSLQNKI